MSFFHLKNNSVFELKLKLDESLLQNRSLFQAICPSWLWALDNRWLLSRVQRLTGPAGDMGLLSQLEAPTGTKGGPFIPVGDSLAPLSPSLSPARAI